MNSNQELLDMVQAALKYSDEDMERIASNPKYLQMLEKSPQLMNTDFIFEIDDAHGCLCQHQKGQQIRINGNGSLNCHESPNRICVYLMNTLTPIVYGAQEFIFAGLDPNELKFTKVGCFDHRAKCGGFGHVSVQFSAQQG